MSADIKERTDQIRADIAHLVRIEKLEHDPVGLLLEVGSAHSEQCDVIIAKLDGLRLTIPPDELKRIVAAAVRGADQRASKLAFAHYWRNAIASAVVVAVVAAAAYWAGGGWADVCEAATKYPGHLICYHYVEQR